MSKHPNRYNRNDDREDMPWRKGVGIALMNMRGQVLVAARLDIPDAWQMPQGGMDEGETPYEAAFRELKEEIGTDKMRLLAELVAWQRYEFPRPHSRPYRGRHRGQEQKWFAALFTGDESDIDLEADAHQEFHDWRWVEIVELPRMIVHFKRPIYEAVLEGFRPIAAQLARGGLDALDTSVLDPKLAVPVKQQG